MRAPRSALGPLLCALALCSCGIAVAPPPKAVEVLVTEDLGTNVLYRAGPLRAKPGESISELLHRTGAHAATGAAGRQGLLFVNGVPPASPAAATSVHPGDHIWLEHDRPHAGIPRAVVGSFPEPFLNGITGNRLPVRVECAGGPDLACQTVAARLQRSGVPAALSAAGSGSAPETLRVMVGSWPQIESDPVAHSIAQGPVVSGVYAHLSADGSTLTLLDADGASARTLHAGAGLIAATASRQEAPLWVITGTDAAGVQLAASSLSPAVLERRFALAVTPTARISLPLAAGPRP